MEPQRPRILVVDDEEAILETMTFTFEDDYDVVTSTDARRALEMLDENGPFAAVLSDQRMPEMSGVEFVTEVWRRHPETVRMILTGFSDMDAIIQAINDGHVYAYITKPWEPEQLKQVMKQAVEHYKLHVENDRLLTDLRRANRFLAAVMDELDVGAIALDADEVVQAVNRPVREFLGIASDPRGQRFGELVAAGDLDPIESAVRTDEAGGVTGYDIELRGHRFRVRNRALSDEAGRPIGRVVLFREVSHEPLQRRVGELLGDIARCDADDALRPLLEQAQGQLRALGDEVRGSEVRSAGMAELLERIARARTAIDNWLEVDDVMASEAFPDAQLLRDRMRVAMQRWPLRDEVPPRVTVLSRRVEEYYESGEKPTRPVL